VSFSGLLRRTQAQPDPDESPNVPVGYYSEAQFTRPTARCPNPERWHAFDIQGTEVEVIAMVAGFIRGLQPSVVLETGTSRGFMAHAIGEALEANGHGTLHSFEPHGPTHTEASKRCVGMDNVELHNAKSMQPWTHGPIGFAWFDSLLELRQREFEHYLPHLSPQAVVGFHDTAPHFGNWTAPLVDVLHKSKFLVLELPTPRGVILGRRMP